MSQLVAPDSSYPAFSRFDEIQFTRLSQKNSFRIQWKEYGHFLKWSSDTKHFFLNTVIVMLKFLADFEGVNISTHKSKVNFYPNMYTNVSVQGVVALGGHFATLCREVNFFEAFFFLIIIIRNGKYVYTHL